MGLLGKSKVFCNEIIIFSMIMISTQDAGPLPIKETEKLPTRPYVMLFLLHQYLLAEVRVIGLPLIAICWILLYRPRYPGTRWNMFTMCQTGIRNSHYLYLRHFYGCLYFEFDIRMYNSPTQQILISWMNDQSWSCRVCVCQKGLMNEVVKLSRSKSHIVISCNLSSPTINIIALC